MKVSYSLFDNSFYVKLTRESSVTVEVKKDPVRNIERILTALRKMPGQKDVAEERLEGARQQLVQAKEEVNKPFEKENELRSVQERLTKINAELDMKPKEEPKKMEELAGLTLSSPDELRKIESGTQQPDKMTLTLLSNVLNVYPDSLQNGEIHYRASQSNLINLMKETLKYLEGTEEYNKEIEEHIEKLQKEYDIQREEKQEKEKTEQPEKEEQVLPKREPEKAAPRL